MRSGRGKGPVGVEVLKAAECWGQLSAGGSGVLKAVGAGASEISSLAEVSHQDNRESGTIEQRVQRAGG